MSVRERVALVRCRLDGPNAELASSIRFVPLGEFELWRFLMETRHRRRVLVEAVSLWMAEEAAVWNSGFAPEELEPVLRVRLEMPGPHGVPVPVERFFPAETYPRAQEALLSHMPGGRSAPVTATPGYFVPAQSRQPSPVAVFA
ncbi:MAG: hypothetical protein ACHQNV_10290 [Vicinamibacteria bacterium]